MGSKVDRRVYVGNLPFYNNRSQKLSWQDLKDHMRTCGEVTLRCRLHWRARCRHVDMPRQAPEDRASA